MSTIICVKKHQQTPLGAEHFRCTCKSNVRFARSGLCKRWRRNACFLRKPRTYYWS